MSEPKSSWLKIAEQLADAAEKARQDGDVAASLRLAVAAAQYLQIARVLQPLPTLSEGPRS